MTRRFAVLGLPAPQGSKRHVGEGRMVESSKRVKPCRRQVAAAYRDQCERMVSTHQAWKPGRTVGRYRAQYLYACNVCRDIVEPGWLPAASAIDWALPAERIADRSRPLSPKTMARIREGLRRYGGSMPLMHRNNTGGAEMSTPVAEPMRTLTTAGHQSLLVPRGAMVVEAAGNTYDMASGSGNRYLRAWPVSDPLRTLQWYGEQGPAGPGRGPRRQAGRVGRSTDADPDYAQRNRPAGPVGRHLARDGLPRR